MACNCENIICLKAFVNPCSEGVELPLVSETTDNYDFHIEFNGVTRIFSVGVIDGDKIIVPTEFVNENYSHLMEIYNSDGDLVNDTCYNLITKISPDAGSFTPIPPSAMPQNYVQMVTMGTPAPINTVFGEVINVSNGNTIQFDALIGAELFSVEQVTEDMAPQTGEGIDAFDDVTGEIALSSSYSNTYFKIQYKK